MVKISVIIPVYNNEEYIGQCLDSVFSQSLRPIEVICIDDGSVDKSYDIMAEYAGKYDNMILLHQENGGAGSARNYGIREASGKYVAFMDGDDFYYDNLALENLYRNAEENRAVICGGSACYYKEGILTSEGLRAGYIFKENGFINYEDYAFLYGYWRFIYQKELLAENKIEFPDYRRFQDPPFFVKAMICAGKFYAVKDYCYCYRREHKEVDFTEEKIADYSKGVRDCLILSKECGFSKLHTETVNIIYDELAAMLYKNICSGNVNLISAVKELNQSIDENLIEKDKLTCRNPFLIEPENIQGYLKGIRKKKESFIERLRDSEEVFVYGAGMVGKRVVRFLKEQNIEVEAVLVTTKNKNTDEIEGIKVLGIDGTTVSDKAVVLIATMVYSHDAIAAQLSRRNITNIERINYEEFQLYSIV